MIIVSQEKDEIVNFDKIESIWLSTDGEGRFTIEATADTNSTLGRYETEERAKEVLQEIIKYYNLLKKDSVYAMGDSGFIFEEKFYYEMPKE